MIRLVEVLAALSLASDVGHDQPLEKSLRNAVIAARIADELELTGEERSATYYVSLLRSMGCTSNSHETAALFGGEDQQFMGLVQRLTGGQGRDWAQGAAQHVAAIAPQLAPLRDAQWFATEGKVAGRMARDSACEVSMSLARRLGLSSAVQRSLDQVYERWDGYGPAQIGGDDLHLPARVSHVVDIVEIAWRSGGVAAVREIARRRSGSHFDPGLAELVERRAGDLFDGLEDADMLEAALDAEPPPHPRRPASELDALARAVADFADLKSPWTLGHSPAVAELAAAAAADAHEREQLLIAGLLHDLGRVAVPNGIWDKAGPLGPSQRERVRLHTYYTERILARTPIFAGYATLAGASRERLDGGGYHRGLGDASLTAPMRVLGVADAYVAMTSARPHREALAPEAARAQLHAEVSDGRLCREAVAAVLEVAGHGRAAAPPPPSGLTEREVEVLALLAQGRTNKQIGAVLFLSPRTVQHHVAHIYDKIDRRTRAGAAMFAMEHRLIGPVAGVGAGARS
jgi:HD-GYP domain-containing protein (c-di-GMP phosphodiesterase class II)